MSTRARARALLSVVPVLGLGAKLRRRYWRQLAERARPWEQQELSAPAVVFAPHQDDETLGCGGVILQKRAAGARVRVVFLTDGSTSHRLWISGEELRRMRRSEAIAACTRLGVPEEDIVFLDFPDGRLAAYQDTAVWWVKEIVDQSQAEQIFTPYALEPHVDHAVANQVVRRALDSRQRPIDVFEYPVWYWYHWPWVSLGQDRRWLTRQVLKNTWSARGGQRLLHDFTSVVPTEDVLSAKRTALAAYRSQMVKPNHDSAWPTLPEVANGEWLECFFQGLEVFVRYRLGGGSGIPATGGKA